MRVNSPAVGARLLEWKMLDSTLEGAVVPARVALMTNCIPAYRVPLLEALQKRVKTLRIFVGQKVVPDRDWHLFHDNLSIEVFRTLRREVHFTNSLGFQDVSFVEVPYDALWVLSRFRPDVVISGEFGVRTILACLYRSLHPRSRLILWATLSERTEATRGKKKEKLRRWILKRVDGVFVNGKSGERYLRALGYGQEKPLGLINQTVDSAAFAGSATRSHRDTLKLFFAGQIVERKGLLPFLMQLMLWCAQHPGQSVEAVVAGLGPELERLRALVPPPSLRLVFPGVASFQELPGYYHDADISIFPTLADEWGVVVNEALTAGLPILASRHSQAVEELIREGDNGWIFDPTDLNDMYAAIDRALTTPRADLDRMRQRAIDSIAGLTPQMVAERMLTVIQRVLLV